MIELPEAHVLAAQIDETLKGKLILNATANASPHKFAWYTGDPAEYQDKLSGRRVTSSNPGMKYTCGGNIEILCEDMLSVLSTPVKYHAPGDTLPKKHQLLLEFDDGSHMSCTVQMWGAMFCYRTDENGLPRDFKINPQPSPLGDTSDEAYFMRLYQDCKQEISVKAFLATEQRIPGLGNGVLQDILFNARLHPKRKLLTLGDEDLHTLYHSLKSTLLDMTMQGGRDTERDLFGVYGGYKTILSKRTLDKPCPVCGGELARQAYLGGNIYFCPVANRWMHRGGTNVYDTKRPYSAPARIASQACRSGGCRCNLRGSDGVAGVAVTQTRAFGRRDHLYAIEYTP